MNVVILMGRLTRDVEVRYSQSSDVAVGRFTIAVEREYQKQGEERQADFVSCLAFGKTAEFIEKYFSKGRMIAVRGRIQTGSYQNKDGATVYYTEVLVDKANFTGEKREDGQQPAAAPRDNGDGFMNIPDGIDDQLPFN